jgi:single-stranded-DNA-specific exonuclease
LSDPGWHAGILGIVAARLVDRFYRPVVLISTMDGVGKGSARSIAGVDLYEGLSNCTQDLENFGGHSMAAGLTIKTENIPQFQRNFETAVHSIIRTRDLKPLVRIDYELDFSDLTANLTDDLESLHPFGSGNPEPLFMARDIKVLSSKIVGQHHRRMRLSQPDGNSSRAFNAIQFNIDTRQPLKDYYDKIAFKLQWNRWNRKKTIQLIIEAT